MLHNVSNTESAPKLAGQLTNASSNLNPQHGGLFLASRSNVAELPASLPHAAAADAAPTRRYPSDLLLIALRRCSAFFAEAAVLVLVFGILDLCLLRGQLKLDWIVGALAISLGLLAASIAMDFSAQRWARACP